MADIVNKAGFVYFILDGHGNCKIGKAIDPPSRLIELQTGSATLLTLFHVIATNDDYWLESKFHRFFAASRIHSEWFRLSDEELAAVRSIVRLDETFVCGRGFDEGALAAIGPITDSAKALGRKGGKKGGLARAAKLSPGERSRISAMGGSAKCGSKPPPNQKPLFDL